MPWFGWLRRYGGVIMRFTTLTDESLLAYHQSVQKQVAADACLSSRFRLISERVKRYTSELQAEMKRRQLRFTPIRWS
jgi:hypothetical protein